MIVYLNGAFVPKAEARVSVDDRGWLFADGVYEVWRLVRGVPFEFDRHLERLQHGLAELRIARPEALAHQQLRAICARLVQDNGIVAEGTLYVQVTRGAAPRTHQFPSPAVPAGVYVVAQPFTPATALLERGASVITTPDVRWGRCDLKTILLLPNVLAKQQAVEAGANEAFFVRDGVLTEGAHTSIFAVVKGVLRTHPADTHVLPGITRALVLELARAHGIRTEQRAITMAELAVADEVFYAGTTTDVTPVVKVDGRVVGDGAPGAVTCSLQAALLSALDAVAPAG